MLLCSFVSFVYQLLQLHLVVDDIRRALLINIGIIYLLARVYVWSYVRSLVRAGATDVYVCASLSLSLSLCLYS